MVQQPKKTSTNHHTVKLRNVTIALGLIIGCVVSLIIFLSFQLRDTLLSEQDQIQNNDVYIQRQIGAEIFRLNRAFERYINGANSYTEFIIKYDILYSRVDQIHKTPFFEQVAKRIGYDDTVLSIRTSVKELDQYLGAVESKTPDTINLFRTQMDEIVTQWEGFSHALLSRRITEKDNWRDQVIQNTNKIAVVLFILFFLFCLILFALLQQMRKTRRAYEREQDLAQKLSQTAQKLEVAAHAKDNFLSRVSHEVRTPLNAISGFAQILTASSLTPKQLQHVNIIDNSAQRLELMFADILDYVDAGKPSFAPKYNKIDLKAYEMDVRLAIQRLIDQSRKNLGLRCEIDPKLSDVTLHSDRELIKRVLLHFAANAIKHSVSGRLYFYILPAPDNKQTIRIGLKDQGVGIDPSLQKKVFQAFTQGDHKEDGTSAGSGMGLAISHRLVALLGGEVNFESKPGSGSNFWMELPLSPPEPAHKKTATTSTE